jgi:hypothetical protein
MTKRTHVRRRQFLVGTGLALAQTAIAGRSTRAAPPEPPAPPALPVAPPKPPATNGVHPKPGAAPGYIVSGRGEDLSNPYFQPQGGPSNKRIPTPKAVHGTGVNENDQGNQNDQGENRQ